MIDINCFVGHWPFRHIPYRTVADLRRLMARTQTHGALVTPLHALLYKDCLSAVHEMERIGARVRFPSSLKLLRC